MVTSMVFDGGLVSTARQNIVAYLCVCVCMHLCVCVCELVSTARRNIVAYLCVCMCMCVRVYMYVCIHNDYVSKIKKMRSNMPVRVLLCAFSIDSFFMETPCMNVGACECCWDGIQELVLFIIKNIKIHVSIYIYIYIYMCVCVCVCVCVYDEYMRLCGTAIKKYMRRHSMRFYF
jgi:hypothetical protein